MAVLKTSFRFPEINLGFVTLAGIVGNLTKKIKNVKCPGVSPGGAWAPLDLTHTLERALKLQHIEEFLILYWKYSNLQEKRPNEVRSSAIFKQALFFLRVP